MPKPPAGHSAPEWIADRDFDALNGFLSELPEGFYSVKNDQLPKNWWMPPPSCLTSAPPMNCKEGYIEGAVNIPMQEIFTSLDQLPATRMPASSSLRCLVIVVPSSSMGLRLMGYTEVRQPGGGMNGWVAAELPVVK